LWFSPPITAASAPGVAQHASNVESATGAPGKGSFTKAESASPDLRWPGVTKARSNQDEPALSVDFAPDSADAAGVSLARCQRWMGWLATALRGKETGRRAVSTGTTPNYSPQLEQAQLSPYGTRLLQLITLFRRPSHRRALQPAHDNSAEKGGTFRQGSPPSQADSASASTGWLQEAGAQLPSRSPDCDSGPRTRAWHTDGPVPKNR